MFGSPVETREQLSTVRARAMDYLLFPDMAALDKQAWSVPRYEWLAAMMDL